MGPDFESKLMENAFLSCEKEFLSKEFKIRSNPDITILMQDKSKQLVVISTSEYDSKMETILQDKSQYFEAELDPSQDFKFITDL